MQMLYVFTISLLSIVTTSSTLLPAELSNANLQIVDREAYLNGSSYLILGSSISMHRHSGLSFRSCDGGRLYQQTFSNGDSVILEVTEEGLHFIAIINHERYEARLNGNMLNNVWQNVNLFFRLGNLTLSAAGHTQIISNATYNSAVLMLPDNVANGTLIIGEGFRGCILQGPGILFNYTIDYKDVLFGPCPIKTAPCKSNGGPSNNAATGRTRFSTSTLDHCNLSCIHGKCVSKQDHFECQCYARYSGKNCDIDHGIACWSSPCRNGGTCNEIQNGEAYICICPHSFTGEHCESQIGDRVCDENPCRNEATCVELYGGDYKCVCAAGWTGKNCDGNVFECTSNPCQNNGICIDGVNNYTCSCDKTGYEGVHCEIDIDECLKKPCLNNGECHNQYGGYVCLCPPEFTGLNCELNTNECDSNPCENGGICIDQVGNYICQCPKGFTGVHCKESVSRKCEDADCPPNSFCVGFQCVCKPGYIGNSPNCTINYCLSNPCENGGTCTNKLDGFECSCPPHVKGKLCQNNIDQCSSKPCYNGGTCINKPNGYVCNCTKDFMGENCEQEFNACATKPCQHDGTCIPLLDSKHDFICKCLEGYEGKLCDVNVDDCMDVICPDNRICVDKIAGYECQCKKGYGGPNCTDLIDPCAANPCINSVNCTNLDNGQFQCQCIKGFKGEKCDKDIDECQENDSLCINGICVNKVGSYQCFCTPGYSGDHCEFDIDECLCGPCKNNATCIDRINNFECHCPPGYEGATCDHEINECQNNPCLNGATCIDKIADYDCICAPGFDGNDCENNIDDCETEPCFNGGKCIDEINSYTCDCTDTGFEGNNCEQNIDDCISNACENNATCVDEIRGYRCECYPGYTGKNCDIDVNECESSPCQYNGTCLERSIQELYTSDFASKPAIFNQPFSYQNASGYECICVQGITGSNCETNIDECKSNPCHAGVCMDRIGSYVCECEKGFEGDHCEFDINECERYQPCKHGTCIDKRADYFCACEPEYGGKNCSVALIGCQENVCKNGGTCWPHLINETEHTFNCTCSNGYYGDVCDYNTTMSLNGKSSYIMATTTRDEGYDIQLRFRTTLPNGLIAMGKGTTLYMLELVNGKLNLHTSLLNKWHGVFVGGGLNDSTWQKVFIAINATHVVLSAKEEQTIYPISSNEGYNVNNTTFPTTFVGGTNASFRHLTHVSPFLVGCIQDVIVNGEWIHSGVVSDTVTMVDVEPGCQREKQCNPNPCMNGGHCTDMWRNFSCKCERPHLGHTCEYNMTAATFGYENITDGYVTVRPTLAAKQAVKSIIDISMFIRTREERGDIFYLGSELDSSQSQLKENTYIYAQLVGGELLPRIQFNGTEGSPITIAKLNDGNTHLIQIIRNVTLVQVRINGTEYFRKTIGANGLINVTVLYLGGLPPAYRFIRQIDNDQKEPLSSPRYNFKGIIQDVQISNGTNTMVVEFYPLTAKDIPPPLPFGDVSFNHSKILQGVVSDNVCVSDPCLHNGTCHVTWNDFWCECPRGYTGKICDEMEFCQLQDCPTGSKCQNLDDGYECIANATFDGSNTYFTYVFEQLDSNTSNSTIDTMEITYRSNTGGTLMYMTTPSAQQHFTVSVYKDNITVSWRLNSENSGLLYFGKEEPDGDWTTIFIKLNNNSLECGYANSDLYQTTPNFNYALWYNVLLTGSVTLGGMDTTPSDRHSYITIANERQYNIDNIDANSVHFTERKLTTPMPPHNMISGEAFKGCIGEVRIGNMLLHYFSHNEVYMNSNFTPPQYFSLKKDSNVSNHDNIGCRLCFDEECKNKGYCLDKYNSYVCECPAGYTEDDCSVDIDECVDNQCKNGAECIDGIANYTCKCNAGWEGRLCEKDIDECTPENPCQHGGVCYNLDGSFHCECPEQFVGQYCENYKLITCNNRPCRNGSTCVDIVNPHTGNNFTCSCMRGYVGQYCDEPYCAKEPCQNDGICSVRSEVPQCDCKPGFIGHYCEINKDDCAVDYPDGTVPCKNDGICIDGINSFTCNCTGTGYIGKDCSIDINECEDPNIKCGFGVCKNLPGDYHCECKKGYCGANCTMADPCVEDYCQNGGTCSCKEGGGYTCQCPPEYTGQNCTETELGLSSPAFNIAIIVGPIVICLLIIAAGLLIALFMMARKKRATRGTYSPSAQEFNNPRVEMDNVMKPPPEERLI